MRPIIHLATAVFAASLVAAPAVLADDAAAPAAAAPPAAQPAPAQSAQAKITKSRSNIQNNREAPPPAKDATATGSEEPAEVVKTKTKSNQSND